MNSLILSFYWLQSNIQYITVYYQPIQRKNKKMVAHILLSRTVLRKLWSFRTESHLTYLEVRSKNEYVVA
jgi:hypothetical protein